MKIGIITFHNVFNYGGILQAYALCQFLRDIYVDCICVDYRQEALTKKYRHRLWDQEKSVKQNVKHFVSYYLLKKNYIKEKKFKAFLTDDMELSKPIYSLEEFTVLANDFDVLISGSDQLWNPQFTGGKLDPVYFLQSDADVRKYAYASSAGARQFTKMELEQLERYLKNYEAIAVREDFLKQQLTVFRPDIEVVLDPTLLLSREKWLTIRKAILKLPKKFVLLYTFDNDPLSIEVAKKISDEMEIPIVSLFKVKTSILVDYTFDDLGPKEFLDLFDKANFVVTNSFHGTAFSINFQKNFYSIFKPSNPHRVMNLVERLGLQNRVLKSSQELPDIQNWSIDFKHSNKRLEDLRIEARNFLTFN